MTDKHTGTCFCGAVEVEVTGAPEAMGYCPLPLLPLLVGWAGERLYLVEARERESLQGAEFVGKFMKTPVSDRKYCTKCGGHLMTDHPPLGLVDVYAATIPSVDFVPGVHVNYSETVLPMKDGLPKLKDFPGRLGGSGIAVPE